MLEFEKWPKTPRFFREIVISEKIDGTNAQVCFDEEGNILCGSRKRVIVPGDDNAGFAAWAYEHRDALFEALGPGRHFGEWWGAGIQRRYGLDHKRFSLFNTHRWAGLKPDQELKGVPGLHVVPTLYSGEFSEWAVTQAMTDLDRLGSIAAPGFMNPEGVIVFHTAARQGFKVTFDHDKTGKPE